MRVVEDCDDQYVFADSGPRFLDIVDSVPTNHAMESFNWLLKSARQGHPYAQYELANCYHKGFGTKPNCSLAIKFYIKSIKQRDEKDWNKSPGFTELQELNSVPLLYLNENENEITSEEERQKTFELKKENEEQIMIKAKERALAKLKKYQKEDHSEIEDEVYEKEEEKKKQKKKKKNVLNIIATENLTEKPLEDYVGMFQPKTAGLPNTGRETPKNNVVDTNRSTSCIKSKSARRKERKKNASSQWTFVTKT